MKEERKKVKKKERKVQTNERNRKKTGQTRCVKRCQTVWSNKNSINNNTTSNQQRNKKKQLQKPIFSLNY